MKRQKKISQVNSLRRELAPHLRFLDNQVKKLERADELRQQLISLAQTYFSIEDIYLAKEKVKVAREKQNATERFKAATAELATIEERATTDAEGAKRLALVRKAEQDVERTSSERGELARKLGRVEGYF